MPGVFYHLSHYISHNKAGRDYKSALRGAGVPLVDDPQAADVLVLHDDPRTISERIPQYRDKTVVAYAVWETAVLPKAFRDSLRDVDRVWTCSPFSAEAFRQAGFAVDVVPHIVRPPAPTPSDFAHIKRLVGFDKKTYYFYTIADSVNPRKNLERLLKAFQAAFGGAERVKLVVKQYRRAWELATLPNVVSIDELLTDQQIAALHALLHCYVSPHCAEAWGLSLSDAMCVGNPVIATGFSGNMFYMNAGNSFPVRYALGPVSEEMCGLLPLYSPDMAWAQVDLAHLVATMRQVRQGDYDPGILDNARRDMRQFRPTIIGAHMKALLAPLLAEARRRREDG